MEYDVVVIGAGISGLSCASLISKRGLKVAIVENAYNPGGSCGIFKRENYTFDQGAAMLYGFGEKGFNSHRFLFNCLEEPIDIIKHDILYTVTFKGNNIHFWPDINKFADELSSVFPNEKNNINRFYKDMLKMYNDVIVDNQTYTTADETDPLVALKSIKKHPLSYIKFLGLLNKSAKSLLEKYFSDPEIFKFFNKLTSTYCYTNVEESPAVLAAVMFVDNHVGGSYYPAGSTMFLPGKLEKVIEENHGDIIYTHKVNSIVFDNNIPIGVKLDDNQLIKARYIVYSGTVWNLYGKLIDPTLTKKKKRLWAEKQIPTYRSVILYSVVNNSVIPKETAPIEMIAGNPDKLDESEITVYIFSIDDKTLCKENEHIVIAIGPTFKSWDKNDKANYSIQKHEEENRLIDVLETKFPGFKQNLKYKELATPLTIEKYAMKNNGAVAGPKQVLGQHMLKRLHTKTEWDNLICCGESTVMGTGTPTVTASGITAANLILKRCSKKTFEFHSGMKNYVNIVEKPFTTNMLYSNYSENDRNIMLKAMKCRYCENPLCTKKGFTDIRGIMRRVSVGNFYGANKVWNKAPVNNETLKTYENNCILSLENKDAVEIKNIIDYIKKYE